MDRDWLARELASGRSIESLARQLERHPSTVAYWVDKHGLASTLAGKHAAKGGVERDRLADLVAAGLSVRALARELGLSPTSVRHWLRRYGLQTRSRRAGPLFSDQDIATHRCLKHGWTVFVRGRDGRHRSALPRRSREPPSSGGEGDARRRVRRPVRGLRL